MASTEPAPELAIIVPVFNERDNVLAMVKELDETLGGVHWEAIFVDDDSPDGTAQTVRDVAKDDSRVRCIQRIGRRGLSTASIEGMLGSAAPYIAVMDGDLQHDPKILTAMLAELKNSDTELVIGSRYVEGGSLGNWNRVREQISRISTRLGHTVVPASLKDPMSGFFMLRRTLLEVVVRNLSGLGFKILLDIFASSPRPVKFKEVPFVFRTRQAGESKLDSQVAWEYLMLLMDKLVGRYVPVQFLSFALIGALGLLVHLAVLSGTYTAGFTDFVTGQSIATFAAIVFNYSMNNVLTYRDKRKRGWKWLAGLFSFTIVCGIGSLANIGIANYLYQHNSKWLVAAIAGVLAGAVWNYALTSVYTWGRKR
jgi:dolichol-phosphate mannosyltransferase